MKINNNDINMNKIMKAYQNMKNKNNDKNIKKTNRNSDEINISQEAKQIKKIKKALQKKSDIREEKVQKIKKAINNGTYKVSPKKIADKIMEELD